jgi:hypothetical protein
MRRSGRHDAHLLRQPQQDHYPTSTPPQHSGGASSTSYRKRRTNTWPPRGSPSDPAHDHQVTRPAATQATLGAATRVRSEPLKTSTHHNASEVFHGAYCRTLLLIEDGLFEVVPAFCPVSGLRHFGERRLGKEVQATSGGAYELHKPDVPPRGTSVGVQRR